MRKIANDKGESVRFMGNKNTKELHDLKNEQVLCQIDKISSRVSFDEDLLKNAYVCGYDNCAYCIGKSLR